MLFDWATSAYYFSYVCVNESRADSPNVLNPVSAGSMSGSTHSALEVIFASHLVRRGSDRMGSLHSTRGKHHFSIATRHAAPDCTWKATAFNFAGLMVARIGIGVFEAGLSPGFPFYLCTSYISPPHSRKLFRPAIAYSPLLHS